MSVYTRIERHDLEEFLHHYPLGTLVSFEGIRAGIENTNYFVTTTYASPGSSTCMAGRGMPDAGNTLPPTPQAQLVLTLFEQLKYDELPYFINLMAFFAERGIPSAHPLADHQQHYLRLLHGKPAALVQRLSGAGTEHPNPAQCRALGSALGRMHVVGQAYPLHRANARGLLWCQNTMDTLLPRLTAQDAVLLQEEVRFQMVFHATPAINTLPRGVIHADLFRDNALFVGDTLTGIIDFYYACNDVLLYDVAVTVNDWCSQPDGALDNILTPALLQAYQQQRPFSPAEYDAWPVMLRAAALRFWLSRLHDLHFPRAGEITHIKDPDVFKRILIHRKDHAALGYMPSPKIS
jgi:homoserine kinase type II